MKTITANEIFYAFAKLQLWFHMSHFYRQPGFYDGVDEMIEMFAGADPDAAYNIIIDRVMADPDEFYEQQAEVEANTIPDDYDRDMEDWIEECSQIGDLFFCIAVCVVAHELYGTSAVHLIDTVQELAESDAEKDRFRAILSTMTDLRINVEELLSTRKPVVA